jgi:hypothetical protein
MKNLPVIFFAVCAFTSCTGGSGKDDKLWDKKGLQDVDSFSTSVPDQTQDETTGDPNTVTFTIDQKEFTYKLNEVGAMFFKSISGTCNITFNAPDMRSSLGIMIDKFASITGPTEITLNQEGKDRKNFIMYIPVMEPRNEKPPLAYVSVNGKIKITAIDWKKGTVSGTFEARDFAEDDSGKTISNVKEIKGSFHQCSFTAY